MAETPAKPTLPTFSWIGHLLDDDRELLSSYGEFFPGHPGGIVIEEGSQQTEVIVVISGLLEVYNTDEEGNRVLRAQVGPGETLGEIGLFDPGPALASVTAAEFSQLWRIADGDLIQFMEDNPGAGNVLLRTLATMLAQRLRQVDPTAFGLSTYAVVESPELAEQDAAADAEAVRRTGHLPVIPLEPGTVPAVPAAAGAAAADAGVPASVPQRTAPVTRNPTPTSEGLTPVQPGLPGQGATAKQPAAALLHKTAPPGGKMSTGTQVLPDPDELEPL